MTKFGDQISRFLNSMRSLWFCSKDLRIETFGTPTAATSWSQIGRLNDRVCGGGYEAFNNVIIGCEKAECLVCGGAVEAGSACVRGIPLDIVAWDRMSNVSLIRMASCRSIELFCCSASEMMVLCMHQ